MGRLWAWTEDSPVNLAVFRVTVGAVLLLLPDLHAAPAWAGLPAAVRTAPVGLGPVVDVVPITPALARVAYAAILICTVAGMVGLRTRAAWLVVAAGGLYLLGIPQLAGSVFHYHHLLWFAALLAASASGDALSVDAWLARRRGAPPPPVVHVAYGLPLRFAWILIGLVFLFPGLWKLTTSGWEWIWSDNLRNQMWAKWAQMPGFEPLFRIDRYPTLVRLGALGVVVFELSFVVLVLFRRTRPFAVVAALAFHQLTAWLMGLRFPALWLCYVAFVDWNALADRGRAWLRRARRPPRASPVPAVSASVAEPMGSSSPRGIRATGAVGAVLLAGALLFGALGINDGWPFACYPKFDRVVAARLPAMEVELVHPDGDARVVPVEWMSPAGRTQRWWALSWSLLGAHERAVASPQRFGDFWRDVASRDPLRRESHGARAVRFYRIWISTVPEERDGAPLARRLLYVLPLES